MKVSALIEELKKVNQDAVVMMYSRNVCWSNDKNEEYTEDECEGVSEEVVDEDGKLIIYLSQ